MLPVAKHLGPKQLNVYIFYGKCALLKIFIFIDPIILILEIDPKKII